MKSKCCGAVWCYINKEPFCRKCEKPCDLAPALRDSKDVLEWVKAEIESSEKALRKNRNAYNAVCTSVFIRVRNFIEGKK